MRSKDSYPLTIWSGLITPEHRKRMGPAIWVFLWLIDKVTREEDGRGYVLGGKPVTCAEIAENLGISQKASVRAIQRLKSSGYVDVIRYPGGQRIIVLKSKKRVAKKQDKNVSSDRTIMDYQMDNNDQSDRTNLSHREDKNVSSASSHDMYKDSTKDNYKDKFRIKTVFSRCEEMKDLSEDEYRRLSDEAITQMSSVPFLRGFLTNGEDGYDIRPTRTAQTTHRMIMRQIWLKEKEQHQD